MSLLRASLLALAVIAAVAGCVAIASADDDASRPGPTTFAPPPVNGGFDYQIGGDYPLPEGVSVVSRDWFSGADAAVPAYSVCYVNAFQTQADESGADRPDEQSNWPRSLVLHRLGDDPNWGGEYLVDIRSQSKRRRAADWVQQMIEGCAEKGFEAVEYDNLDSWTRFDGTPLADRVPFDRADALAFAKLLAARAHALGLAVAQKNTADVTTAEADRIGFDFVVAEECARYNECNRYRSVHGDNVIAIEYRRADFRKACQTVGPAISVVLRDRNVSLPGSRRYVYDAC